MDEHFRFDCPKCGTLYITADQVESHFRHPPSDQEEPQDMDYDEDQNSDSNCASPTPLPRVPSLSQSQVLASHQELIDTFCGWMASKEEITRSQIENYVNSNSIDLSALHSVFRHTPLAFAAASNNLSNVRILLELPEPPDIEQELEIMENGLKCKMTLLWLILTRTRYDYTEMIRLLLLKGTCFLGFIFSIFAASISLFFSFHFSLFIFLFSLFSAFCS
jgi:hypothetical protein